MYLYPTETVYGLGSNVFDAHAMLDLYVLKGRSFDKQVSWLVRDLADIERYAEIEEKAVKIAERFLPGPLTLILPLKAEIIKEHNLDIKTVGFRISSDSYAQKLIADFMSEHNAPLTCTSANVSGMPTLASPEEILAQFNERAHTIDTIIDGGKREGVASTVVSVIDGNVQIIREGAIATEAITGMFV